MTESYKPAEDLNHHVVSADHRYGCFEGPGPKESLLKRVKQFLCKDGTYQTQWMDIGCGHTYRATDPSCTNCKRRTS